jgi:integrase
LRDLTGKGRRIRTVPIPTWAMAVLNDWLGAAGITAGPIFRPIDKTGRVGSRALGAQTIYNIVREHVPLVDPAVRPHDLRRSFARLAYENHAAIEQLSITLGHASIATTERYIGAKQNFRLAPCDLVMPAASKEPPKVDPPLAAALANPAPLQT